MTDGEDLLGVPEVVRAAVEVLVFAETRGPAAVDRELDRLDPDVQRAVLRHLLGRLGAASVGRRTGRRAWEHFDREEAKAERTGDRSWAR